MPIKNGESCVLGPPVYGILVAEEAQDGLKCSSSSLYISTGNMMHLGTCFSSLIHDLCF